MLVLIMSALARCRTSPRSSLVHAPVVTISWLPFPTFMRRTTSAL
jgi:hypothetical protein